MKFGCFVVVDMPREGNMYATEVDGDGGFKTSAWEVCQLADKDADWYFDYKS